jgi:hypothetical protein
LRARARGTGAAGKAIVFSRRALTVGRAASRWAAGDDDLRQQVAFLASTVSEMLEGMNVSKSVELPNRQVRKSKPAMSYSGQEDIASVLKSLVAEIRDERNTEREERDPWQTKSVVKKSMQDFTANLSGIAGGLWPKQ